MTTRARRGAARPLTVLALTLGAAALLRATDASSDLPAGPRLLVLPALDLSAVAADRSEVDAALASRLAVAGFDLVPRDEAESFLLRHRVRHTGGLAPPALEAARLELAVDAVLSTSVDLWDAGPPPRVGLASRAVDARTGRIVWAAEVSRSGEDRPGVLGLRAVAELDALLEIVAQRLLGTLEPQALARHIADPEAARWDRTPARAALRPRRVFRSASWTGPGERALRVAVLPFDDRSATPDAGDVVAGLFAIHLAGRPAVTVVDPAEVRDALLRGRLIQADGLSLSQADLVRELLDVDLAVTGRVLEFTDAGGLANPRVAWSVWVFDVRHPAVVWSAYSSNRGDDGFLFFPARRDRTARALASGMARAAAGRLAADVAPSVARVRAR